MSDMPANISAAFDAAGPEARAGMIALRSLIFDIADAKGILLTEALRWGQPAYLAPRGSTLRLGVPKQGGAFALFAHCQTSLIADFREATGGRFPTEKNRAVLFESERDIDSAALAPMIKAALTWHEKKPK